MFQYTCDWSLTSLQWKSTDTSSSQTICGFYPWTYVACGVRARNAAGPSQSASANTTTACDGKLVIYTMVPWSDIWMIVWRLIVERLFIADWKPCSHGQQVTYNDIAVTSECLYPRNKLLCQKFFYFLSGYW